MLKNKKILLTILLIFIVAIISFFIGTNVANKSIIRNQSIETQKLTATSEENGYVKTTDHLSEVNTSLQTGIEQGKLAIWEAIRNSEVLSAKTDSSGNPIYGNVTDIESLENAISSDNDNSAQSGKITIDGYIKHTLRFSGHFACRNTATFRIIITNGVITSCTLLSNGQNQDTCTAGWTYTDIIDEIGITSITIE